MSLDRRTRSAASSGGLFNSARRILVRLLALAQTRLELFTTELSAEVSRAAVLLLWAFVALFFGGLTVLMIALTVIIAFWDNRLLAAAVCALLFLAVTIVAALTVRRRLRSRTTLLAASIEELRRDRQALGEDR